MDRILLGAALLPAVVLMFYVYSKDRVEKEPVGVIVRLLVLGAVAGPIAAIVENIAFELFESFLAPGMLLLVLENFIGVAAVEEGFKYLFLNTMRKSREFNYVFDGVVYGVAVSLGFAALENVLYVFDGGLEVAVMRAIFSVPGHCAGGVVMGCFFGLARQRAARGNKSGARVYYWLAFLLPVIEHGFYDFALSAESDGLSLLALAVELAFIGCAFVLVNHMSKNDSPIGAQAQGLNPSQVPYGAANPYYQQAPGTLQGQNQQHAQHPQQWQRSPQMQYPPQASYPPGVQRSAQGQYQPRVSYPPQGQYPQRSQYQPQGQYPSQSQYQPQGQYPSQAPYPPQGRNGQQGEFSPYDPRG